MDMTLDMYIEKLQKIKEVHGGDILIVKTSDNYETNFSIEALSEHKVFKVRPMKKIIKFFRDDFDGTTYSLEVYEHCEASEKNSLLALEL